MVFLLVVLLRERRREKSLVADLPPRHDVKRRFSLNYFRLVLYSASFDHRLAL